MLKNKIVVITGGAGLIGKSFIEAVIENRGIAIIADYDNEKGMNLQNECVAKYGMGFSEYVHLDITSKKSIAKMVSYLIKKYKKIDSVVNNAYPQNKNYGKHFFEVSYEDFCHNLTMNVGGYFQVSQILAKLFQQQGYGNIINIASIYGVIAPRFEIYKNTDMTTPVEYAAIKSAIIHLTKYMAKYFKGMNIRVNSISPGGITDQQPLCFKKEYTKKTLNKGMLDAHDLKGALIFLLSDFSMYVNGQNIIVDDGFSL